MTLSETELRIIANALHVAAVEYGKDAAISDGNPRLVECFKAQANDALAIASRITDEIG